MRCAILLMRCDRHALRATVHGDRAARDPVRCKRRFAPGRMAVTQLFEGLSASSARFSSRTLTRGSPTRPNNLLRGGGRHSMIGRLAGSSPRMRATRAAW